MRDEWTRKRLKGNLPEEGSDLIRVHPNGSVFVGEKGFDWERLRTIDVVVIVADRGGKSDEATLEVRTRVVERQNETLRSSCKSLSERVS